MNANKQPDVWLRGSIGGVTPLLIPVASALLQAREDIERAAAPLAPEQLWARPGEAASVGFHLRHVAGSIDRLLTYARGESLSDAQRAALAAEGVPGTPPAGAAELVARVGEAIDGAVVVLRATDWGTLHQSRQVGRAKVPSTVFRILFHVAEHTQRHAGQVITTAKIVGSLGGSSVSSTLIRCGAGRASGPTRTALRPGSPQTDPC